jgi:hypothetical protein
VPYPVFGAPAGIVVVGVGVIVGLAVCAKVAVAAAKKAIAANSVIIVFCVNVIYALTTFQKNKWEGEKDQLPTVCFTITPSLTCYSFFILTAICKQQTKVM